MENTVLKIIQIILLLAVLYIIFQIARAYQKKQASFGDSKKFFTGFLIGFITDLLDTWGIGSFATTTTLFKFAHFHDDDKNLPGTMTVGHAIPVIVEAFLFITVVKIEMTTLIPMTSAAILGAFFGTRITKNWNAKLVRGTLGILLIVAAIIMLLRLILNPGENLAENVHGLSLYWLIGGLFFNCGVGILMTMGLGNYAPELVFFSLAGVNPLIALPVMMLDAAMIMTTSVGAFIKQKRVYWPGLLGIALGGILGVFFAAKILTTINLELFKILTIVIVIYTGVMLILESLKAK
ncbi:TSUP family transporter [Lactococcus hircilactis]|uniref:Probable membrane transporter protein n=1 Tax=Lactococcus hircilactis TaxID=1494462 RepID=A0A7X1Z725_9LACT|nr:sulfite exporter TauE/SafE family protein [Lactococcus hircilactis]MQW38921.1 TSUP family transporter [Lactococcus hircilactis]